MAERIVYRGIRLAIDSFWLMWRHKKILFFTLFMSFTIMIFKHPSVGYTSSDPELIPMQVILLFWIWTELIFSTGFRFLTYNILLDAHLPSIISAEYIMALLTGFISLYMYAALQKKTATIRSTTKNILQFALPLLALAIINALVLYFLNADIIDTTKDMNAFKNFMYILLNNAQFIASIAWILHSYFVVQCVVLDNKSIFTAFKDSFKFTKKITSIIEGSIFIYMYILLSPFLVLIPSLFLLPTSRYDITNFILPLTSITLSDYDITNIFFTTLIIGITLTWTTTFATKLYHQLRSSN